MSLVVQSKAYPAAMDQKLRLICRRQMALHALRAVMLGIGVLLSAMVAAMVVDLLLTLVSGAARLLLTTVSLAVSAAVLTLAGRHVFESRARFAKASRDVDGATPQLEERWSTVAAFAESKSAPESVIGQTMLRQVTSEAVALSRLVQPEQIATTRQLHKPAALLVVAVVLFAGFLVGNWPHHRVLLQRFWSPLTDITATQLTSLTGNLISPRGEPVELVVKTSGLSRDAAMFEIVGEDIEKVTVPIAADPEQSHLFRYSIDSLESSFRYRVAVGDGRTDWYQVTAIDRPVLQDVRLTVTPPKYIDRPAYEKDYLPTHIQAAQGSRLQLAMRPNVPLKQLVLEISQPKGSTAPTEALDESDSSTRAEKRLLSVDKDGWYRFETGLDADLTLVPALLSRHGLSNDEIQKCRIRVLPDRAPVARLIAPKEEASVAPDEVMEIEFEAHDDYGIAKAELIVYGEPAKEGEPPTVLGTEEIPLDDQRNAAHLVASAKLDLSKYDIPEGGSISYSIRVTDNRNSAPDDNALVENPSGTKEKTSEGKSNPADERTPRMAMNDARDRASAAKEKAVDNTNTKTKTKTEVDSNAIVKSETSNGNSEPPNRNSEPSNGDSEPAKGKSELANGDSVRTNDVNKLADATDKNADGSDKRTDEGSTNDRTDGDQNRAESGNKIAMSEKSKLATSEKGAEKVAANSKGPADAEPVKADETPPAPAEATAQASAETKPSTDPAASPMATDLAANAATEKMPVAPTEDRPSSSESKDHTPSESAPMSPMATDTPVASSGAAPRNSERKLPMEGGGESNASGDLRTAELRPKMTDDLKGQFTESNRLRVKIAEKLVSAADAGPVVATPIQIRIRQRLEHMQQELKPAEESLAALVSGSTQSAIADPQIKQLEEVDSRLAHVEKLIAELREESKDSPYAFVGLHMVELGTTQIAPARDRVFALTRQPDVDTSRNLAEALQRVSRAQELIAELLVRYERVLREERLASNIDETVKFYEVYVENLHRFLLAQSRPNPNPLQRKMAVVEVDQDYLDRLRQVTEMRRDLMSEFARMLADDPRLLSKYMDLVKRRQTSLRDRLTQLHERQEVIATELAGWLQVDEAQREDVWMLALEVRLQDFSPLAQEVSQLEEHVTSQFPLALKADEKAASVVVRHMKDLAAASRSTTAKARRLLRDPLNDSIDFSADVDDMLFLVRELDASLDDLVLANADGEVADYVTKRQAEVRLLSERIAAWAGTAAELPQRNFEGVARVDQQQLAFLTELLRADMNGIDDQLNVQFQGEVPQVVTQLATQLKDLMEAITFNQAAATFDLESKRSKEARAQQQLALERFEQAEELFDQIRRTIVEELDKQDPRDPSIADLEDPTLDEILARLEREPDLAGLLGLPNRPQNLRVFSDFFAQRNGEVPVPNAMAQSSEQARRRAEKEKEQARMRQNSNGDGDQTEEEWRQVANAEEAQEKLEAKVKELEKQANDPATDPEEAERMRQMARQLSQMQRQLAAQQIDQKQWEEMVRSDQMQAIMRAAASGQPLPEGQWNRLMSSLDDGLWQVRRRTPPEEFRTAIEQYQERIRVFTNAETADARE